MSKPKELSTILPMCVWCEEQPVLPGKELCQACARDEMEAEEEIQTNADDYDGVTEDDLPF